ncbi:hypothetical protein [Allopontixanthobacter sediminis]|uniref:Aminoglycoside phosphotransferase domain-containing protein n=1 Tax=Allopontixanthobacter sediminis TaxID=1689985 RepID=A0A845AYB1_9SPHN|nr:hypothetical protein [Allopontixanthobacter sediminis]MXP44493.1 hypothetical protein [Allopontixanthobacter sediminis]
MSQSRRQSLRLIAGAAIMPLMAGAFPRIAAAAENPFDPPAIPMLLSRTVLRDLPDGAQISVHRSWEVRFERERDGFSVNGSQISVEVDAPPTLLALAQMEQSREEIGLFPMVLSTDGTVIGGEESPGSIWFDRAVSETAEQIEAARIPGTEAEKVLGALSALHRSATGLTGKVPRDLFRPRSLEWQLDRTMDLPGGLSGTIAVLFNARLDAAGGLMERCERQIVSTIGGSSRTSSEIWNLART